LKARSNTKFSHILTPVSALKHFPWFSRIPHCDIFEPANYGNGFRAMA